MNVKQLIVVSILSILAPFPFAHELPKALKCGESYLLIEESTVHYMATSVADEIPGYILRNSDSKYYIDVILDRDIFAQISVGYDGTEAIRISRLDGSAHFANNQTPMRSIVPPIYDFSKSERVEDCVAHEQRI